MENFRRFVRYRCEHPLWVRPYKRSEGEYQLVEVQNISAGGAYFVSGSQLQLNEVLEITMEIPHEYAMLTMRGPVRHIKRNGGLFYCGLAFEHVSDMKPKAFSSYIEKTFAQAANTPEPACVG